MVSSLANDKIVNNNERYAQESEMIIQDSKFSPRENYGDDPAQTMICLQESIIHGSDSQTNVNNKDIEDKDREARQTKGQLKQKKF